MYKLDKILVRDKKKAEIINSINVPIYLSSIFEFPDIDYASACFKGEIDDYIYSRVCNPTVKAFEDKMVELEGGVGGFAFASGIAAITAVILATCKPGDVILCVEEVYGGTWELLKTVVKDLDISVELFPPNLNFQYNNLEKTKLIFAESPTNPSLHTVDLNKLKEISKNFPNAYICIDNTFATPYHQQPIRESDVDVVLHSATKYIGGHGDLIGGVVVSNDRLVEKLGLVRKTTGGIMSPFVAYLCLRGLKTLALRMARHDENARALFKVFLRFKVSNDEILEIKYPEFGGMISVVFKTQELVKKFVEKLDVAIAVSLGETQTLINVPSLMTHSTYTKKELEDVGIEPGLIRISTGIENPEELAEEFEKALKEIK